MRFYRITHRDGTLIARVTTSSPKNARDVIFNCIPPLINNTDGKILKWFDEQQFRDYVSKSDPNTLHQDFIVKDELRLLDAEIDRQVFGNEVKPEASDKPVRTADRTPVPEYSTNEAEAEKAWSHAMEQLCRDRPDDFVRLCQNGYKDMPSGPTYFRVWLYELEDVTASTKAHALSLAALKTVADISQFIP